MSQYSRDDISQAGLIELERLMAEAAALKDKGWLRNLFLTRDFGDVMDDIDELFGVELMLKGITSYEVKNN